MIRPTGMAYFLGAGVLILAGCVGSNQQESPTPTLAPIPSPSSTPTLAPIPSPTFTSTLSPTPNPSATPTHSPTPTPTITFGLFPHAIVTLLPKDAIPAILEPKFTSPQFAEDQMTDTEQVIGVSINGDARAYPINILSRHEIVNDVVGGKSIAVTW